MIDVVVWGAWILFSPMALGVRYVPIQSFT